MTTLGPHRPASLLAPAAACGSAPDVGDPAFENCMGVDVAARREDINEHAGDLDRDLIDG